MRDLWSLIADGHRPVRKRPVYRTILDLGTQQIKALVLEVKGDEGLVVGAGRARCQQAPGMEGTGVDVQAISRSCDQALRQAEDMTAEICGRHVVPDWAVIGLPNHLTVAQAYAVSHHRSDPGSQIGEKELRQVAERAQRLALQQLSRRSAGRFGAELAELELLEACISDIMVDGYSVTSPLSFRGENLTVVVFNVVVASSHLRAITALTDSLGLEALRTLSTWQALASVLRGKDGICIDVGGKATDIALVRNGKTWSTVSLPLGGDDFTRHLAQTFGLSSKDAEALKLAYGRAAIDPSAASHVAEALVRVKNAWLAGVEDALKRVAGSRPLPYQFHLCGGGSSLPGMAEVMRSHRWTQELSFSRHPQVRMMQPIDVPRVLDRTGQLRGQQYVASLALASHSLTGESSEGSLTRVLWGVKRPHTFAGRGGKG